MPITLFKVVDSDERHFPLEVVMMILKYCPFSSLVTLTRGNRQLRRFILHEIFERRVDHFICLFIPRNLKGAFFKLLSSSNASMVGSVVRCIISNDLFDHLKHNHVDPIQLDIVVPNSPSGAEAHSQNFRKWKRFVYSCGYHQTCSTIPENFRASVTNRSLLCTNGGELRKISLIEAKGSSVYPPVFQASQTSTFFFMSSTRIYSLYPGLHDHGFNLTLKRHTYEDLFDRFNYGNITFRTTDDWEAFSGGCGEACPSVHRFTQGFPGWIVFRWGGFGVVKDLGDVVSADDPYDEEHYAWKLEGECAKEKCENFLVSTDLFSEAF